MNPVSIPRNPVSLLKPELVGVVLKRDVRLVVQVDLVAGLPMLAEIAHQRFGFLEPVAVEHCVDVELAVACVRHRVERLDQEEDRRDAGGRVRPFRRRAAEGIDAQGDEHEGCRRQVEDGASAQGISCAAPTAPSWRAAGRSARRTCSGCDATSRQGPAEMRMRPDRLPPGRRPSC